MKRLIWLETLLPTVGAAKTQQLALFAIVNLGVIEALQGGLLTPTDALGVLYHAQNCFYIHQQFPDTTADIIMSHGIQLPDLFDVLPPELAQRNLYQQLEEMRSLCFNLLEKEPMAA
jgi:hypothetical protein